MEILFAMEIMIQPSFTITSTSPDLQQVHRLEEGVKIPPQGFYSSMHILLEVYHELRGRASSKPRLRGLSSQCVMKHMHTAPRGWAISRQRHALMKCWQHTMHRLSGMGHCAKGGLQWQWEEQAVTCRTSCCQAVARGCPLPMLQMLIRSAGWLARSSCRETLRRSSSSARVSRSKRASCSLTDAKMLAADLIS